MHKLFRIVRFLLVAAVLAGAFWYVFRPGGRRHQGRAERDWIANLAHQPSDKELQEWQSLGPEAVPMLVRALGKGTSPLRKWYQASWYKLPRPVKMRLGMPQDPVPIRRNALFVLDRLTCDISPAAPALARALHDDDQDVRNNAALCLKDLLPKMGAGKARLVPALVDAMQDTNHLVRENVTQCLGSCPEQSAVIAPALVRAFDDSVQFNRYLAVQSLKRMDLEQADKRSLEPMLLRSLGNGDLVVCLNAAAILSREKWDPPKEVAAFTEMLNDYLPAKQHLAAVALGKYGPQAVPAVPALRRAFETGEPRVRDAARNSIVEIDPQAAAKMFTPGNAPVSAATP